MTAQMDAVTDSGFFTPSFLSRTSSLFISHLFVRQLPYFIDTPYKLFGINSMEYESWDFDVKKKKCLYVRCQHYYWS